MAGTYGEASRKLNASQLQRFGEPITYLPAQGAGSPIATLAIPGAPLIDQSSAPGYFADIEVDPLVITNPLRRDVVVWADGTQYVVGKVVNDVYGLTKLAIHRMADPA